MASWLEKKKQLLESLKKDPHLVQPGGHLLDFSKETDVVTLVVGDLHGDLTSMQLFFDFFESLEQSAPGYRYRWLLLGDYVDRGPYSAGVLDFLLEKRLEKLANQEVDDIYLLRGNHEDWERISKGVRSMVAPNPGHPLFIGTLDEETRQAYLELFQAMPCAALLPGGVLAVHGSIPKPEGFPPEVSFPGIETIKDIDSDHILRQMLWGDPVDVEFRMIAGTRFEFGRKQSHAFLEQCKLSMIIRGHEAVPGGFDLKHEGRVATVFSSGGASPDTAYPAVKTPAVLVLRGDHYTVFRRTLEEELRFSEEEFPVPPPLGLEPAVPPRRIATVPAEAVLGAEESDPRSVGGEAGAGDAAETKQDRPAAKEKPQVVQELDLYFLVDAAMADSGAAAGAALQAFLEQLQQGSKGMLLDRRCNLLSGYLGVGSSGPLFLYSPAGDIPVEARSELPVQVRRGSGAGGGILGDLAREKETGSGEETAASLSLLLEGIPWRNGATRHLVLLTDTADAQLESASLVEKLQAERIVFHAVCLGMDGDSLGSWRVLTELPGATRIIAKQKNPDWSVVFRELNRSISVLA